LCGGGVTSAPQQAELFDIAEVAGFAALGLKERRFVEALFAGESQRNAARAAGYLGSDEVIDVVASKLVRRAKVQGVMGQAWARSGASIERNVAQAAEIAARAFAEWQTGETAERRRAAHAEWLKTATLLASIHGKLQLKVSGAVTVNVVSEAARAHLQELQRAGVETGLPMGRN
jgi:phage terminase small subunit